MNYDTQIPYYAVHEDGKICGFFGPFRWMSNFFILENGIWYEELMYPCVENCYQACKYSYNQRNIFTEISPGEAKRLGKNDKQFILII